jgi:hypothetical protein
MTLRGSQRTRAPSRARNNIEAILRLLSDREGRLERLVIAASTPNSPFPESRSLFARLILHRLPDQEEMKYRFRVAPLGM